MSSTRNYPVGARVIIRDEEWRITEVDQASLGATRLKCVGVSDLVRGRTGIFFDCYELDIRILRPEKTRLVEDHSPGFMKSRLYLEALLRASPKTDSNRIEVADRAAMDPLPYQFNPTLQALAQPRARILIADAVGIGKTLEAGILTSELIARGRGRRILVLATKAMLTQFQREFWTRFTIPLTRLDSAGIQRVRNRIPANHNPFLYFDRSIISIDTLKQDHEYREYLSKAWWDVIIIDEAHNVAERNSRSQRAKLAQLLAGRSDTMILLSATPHDGRSESFASLLNILDPTAIPDPSNYTVDDFAGKGLVIRRFKSDVKDQVRQAFPDREISTDRVTASEEETAVFDALGSLTFETLDAPIKAGGESEASGSARARLFSTTLLKAFLSSPAACASVIANRLRTLEKNLEKADEGRAGRIRADMEKLRGLAALVDCVGPKSFTKLQRLVQMLGDGEGGVGWDRKDPADRLVIFTESVKTLDFLAERLPKAAGLGKDEVITLSGAMKDTEIAERVNQFNRADSPVRLLLASDVASEGINLHHFSHRMIHFDIPWALMTFQQRNGRIDRYGQTKVPQIRYLQTVTDAERSRSDERVLDRLIEKDAQVQKNLADPAEFLLSVEEQEDRTAAAIEAAGAAGEAGADGAAVDPFAALDDSDFSLDDVFASIESDAQKGAEDRAEREARMRRIAPVLSPAEFRAALAKRPALFSTDMEYARAMLRWLSLDARRNGLSGDMLDLSMDHRILLGIPPDLAARLRYLPAEVLPPEKRFDLTDDVKALESEMLRCRATGEDWPHQTLLWPLHPVMLWLEDRAIGLFGRHTAPLLKLAGLPEDETWLLLEGGYPNRRGFIPVHRWIVLRVKGGAFEEKTLEDLIESLGLSTSLSNLTQRTGEREVEGAETDESAAFAGVIRESVKLARKALAEARRSFDATQKAELKERLDALEALKQRHVEVAGRTDGDAGNPLVKRRIELKRLEIERNFEAARRHLVDTAELEAEPWLQLQAVFTAFRPGASTQH